jgi:hypothetical protein
MELLLYCEAGLVPLASSGTEPSLAAPENELTFIKKGIITGSRFFTNPELIPLESLF